MEQQKKIFGVAWRLAIIALPWQTRWFSDATLAGWPWEQGRASVYLSWFLIVATIGIGYAAKRETRNAKHETRNTKHETSDVTSDASRFTFYASLSLIAISFFATVSPIATFQWWIQVLLLAAFGWTLFSAQISSRAIATWFVISLVPHVALSCVQFATQQVVGSAWFGIAAQDPRNLGVSVVEAGPFRALRAYGGFPHPNIFGGWLAIGWLVATSSVRQAMTKLRAFAWMLIASAIAVALFLTFARGAWIAAAVGAILVFRHGWKCRVRQQRTALSSVICHLSSFLFILSIVCSMFVVGIVAFAERDLLVSRLHPSERLEVKSLDTRWQSLADGWRVFRAHPFFGTGPNAEIVEVVNSAQCAVRSAQCAVNSNCSLLTAHCSLSTTPAEPPHNAYLLALVNFGIIGMIVCIWIVAGSWQLAARGRIRLIPSYALRTTHYVLPPLALLALFDHYPWSLWSGQTLVLLTMLIAWSPQRQLPAEDSTA